MQQAILNTIPLAVVGVIGPTTTTAQVAGTSLAAFTSIQPGGFTYVLQRFMVQITLAGAGTSTLRTFVATPDGSLLWGAPIDPGGNLGAVAGGAALGAGMYFFVLEDIALFSQVCISKTDVDNTKPMTAVATISGIWEKTT